MTYPHLPYAVTEVYCILFALTVWLRLNNSIGSEHEVRQLRNMIYSYLAMLVTDVLWALMEDNLLVLPRLLNAAINAVTVMAVVFGCYFWFRFIEDRLHFARRSLDTLLKLPLLIVCTLDVISIFTGWLFYIDAQGHFQNAPLFFLHTTTNYFYLLIPTGYSLYRAARTHSRQDRSEYLTYALYMVAPLISGMLEDVFPLVPLLALNIFLMILILFLMIQNLQIYNDALTGLNNRRRLNRYLEECLSRASAERPILVFLMDINSFKSINDLYGHLEGDCALKTFAAVLKNVSARYYAFAARYGGDEFCLVMNAAGHAPAEITEALRQALQEVQRGPQAPAKAYTLSVSVGCAVCDRAGCEANASLALADSLLYADKKRWHESNR
jgi:diguanylate cyclase (GGDEF)-like protein